MERLRIQCCEHITSSVTIAMERKHNYEVSTFDVIISAIITRKVYRRIFVHEPDLLFTFRKEDCDNFF